MATIAVPSTAQKTFGFTSLLLWLLVGLLFRHTTFGFVILGAVR